MAAYGRTVSALVRHVGRRRFSCFKTLLARRPSARVVCGVSPVCARTPVQSAVTWTTQGRALSSEIPFKEEDYPPLPEYSLSPETEQKEVFIVHVKGLPWTCGAEDLLKFFADCRIPKGVNGIQLMYHKNGKPTGQAFIELEDEEDVNKALEMHRQYLGPRYVEVYEVTNKDAEAILKGTDDGQDGVVRIRGLPFSCTEKDIIQFFSGLDIVKDGVTLVMDRLGRISGDAFVQFDTQEMADEALKRDREVIGSRYIEVYPSKKSEIQSQYSRGRGDATVTAACTQKTDAVCLPTQYIPYQTTAGDIINTPFKEEDYPPLPESSLSPEKERKEVFIVRVKGLPWTCGAEDLLKFFADCRIPKGVNGIHLMYHKNGKPTGQAFIELEDEEDVNKALEMHRQYLGPRYVEVYEVTNRDAEAILKGTDDGQDGVVRIRGLPFSCTEKDIIQFFSGLDIVKDGVTLVMDRLGRISGDAFVQFDTQEMADEALKRDREVIGSRYIKVYPSKKSEIQSQYSRGRGDATVTAARTQKTAAVGLPTQYIHMRGIPYQTTAGDIINFFHPIRVAKVLIEYGPDGKLSGEAEVHFKTRQDAVEAMTRDRQYIQDRYIELYLNSS